LPIHVAAFLGVVHHLHTSWHQLWRSIECDNNVAPSWHQLQQIYLPLILICVFKSSFSVPDLVNTIHFVYIRRRTTAILLRGTRSLHFWHLRFDTTSYTTMKFFPALSVFPFCSNIKALKMPQVLRYLHVIIACNKKSSSPLKNLNEVCSIISAKKILLSACF